MLSRFNDSPSPKPRRSRTSANTSSAPTNRTYAGITSDQTAQNYDALVFGDVAAGFVHRPGNPSPDMPNTNETPATVASVTLPSLTLQSDANAPAGVTTAAIDAKANLVGFQCDFTFDERAVTFETDPVQKAGLTGGNWNVSGNVLPGTGPIRTLRVSAYSQDFSPLSGVGTLFELRMKPATMSAQRSQLIWASSQNPFFFIDADLNVQRPGSTF